MSALLQASARSILSTLNPKALQIGTTFTSKSAVPVLPRLTQALRSVVEMSSYMADAEAGLLARHMAAARVLEVRRAAC